MNFMTSRFLRRNIMALVGVPLLGAVGFADPVLPSIIGSNMVLQAERAVPIWGRAEPGERIEVRFLDQSVATVADAQGNWVVKLAPLKASSEGRDLTVVGKKTVTLSNVVVGEVWLGSGQSNMGWKVEQADDATAGKASTAQPNLRLFTVKRAVSAEAPLWDCEGSWVECTPDVAAEFSAVAFILGHELSSKSGKPVGLIHSSWGGTRIRAWMPQWTIDARPELAIINEAWERELADFPRARAEFETDLPRLRKEWEMRVAAARAAGQAPPPEPKLRTGPNTQYVPAALYNGMIAPLVPFALRGVVWYQGESDVDAPLLYGDCLVSLVQAWREAWQQPDQAFICVQLPNIDRQPEPSRSGWAELRESQVRLLDTPNTALVVTIDVGDPGDIHPINKLPVGQRVARAAEGLVYGSEPAVSFSPVPAKSERVSGALRVSFKYAGNELGTSDGEAPRGFAVAGADRVFHAATARIEGDAVILSSPAVSDPVAARYAWADNPDCNLVSGSGLPASPFRTDSWATLVMTATELAR